MIALQLSMRLVEPVLATGIEGDPNSAVSLSYIPGSAIRGAVIERYRQSRKDKQLDAAQEAEQRLFFDGRTRFLNAHPLVQVDSRSARGLPAPLAWRKEKGQNDRKIFDFSVAAPPIQQTKSVTGFYTIDGGSAYFADQPMQVSVHTQRDAQAGRPVSGSGAVFRFQALAAGRRFQSVILFQNEADLTLVQNLLERGDLLLGGARAAGYGRVQVEAMERLPEDWREPGYDAMVGLQPYDNLSLVAMHCLSDILLRDENGQYTLDPLPALKKHLGSGLTCLGQPSESENGEERIFRKNHWVGGFNRKAALPLAQASALAAGSVFVLRADEPISGQALLDLEERGIGERKAEGFGRIAFFALTDDVEDDGQSSIGLKPMITQVDEKKEASDAPDDESAERAVLEMDDAARAMTLKLLRRLLENRIEKKLQKCVNAVTFLRSARHSNHAIARWRVLVRACLAAKTPQRLNKHLENEVKKNSPAWRAFQRTRIELNGVEWRLSDWLEKALSTDENVPWMWIGGKPVEELGAGEHRLSCVPADHDSVTYTLLLIDGLLAKLAHQEGEN